jgi:DNA-binding CsgD family transcriptional regulator
MSMNSTLQGLSGGEVKLLLGIIEKLSTGHEQDTFRKDIAPDLLRLLKSDFIASFIWNEERQVFENEVFLNMDPSNIARYDHYFQFHDPITLLLQKRRKATLVYEVMPKKELEKTEFFNDFLMRDGLHHGINVYAYDGDLNIGDLRIWRKKQRPDYGKRDAALLDTILPHFRNALRNARSFAIARANEETWEKLFDLTGRALFLFDENGRLLYRNRVSQALESDMRREDFSSFYTRVQTLARKDLSRTRWGPFFLSFLEVPSPDTGRPQRAVMAYSSGVPSVDRALLKQKHGLSRREAEIALLICRGLTDKEIAQVLCASFSTVRTHIKHLFSKLDVTTRSELIFVLVQDLIDLSF